mmetsp:Transcript_38202/g.82767  ORF Transcript_38202/g.82767 Transcript_38202/m.82767 type:complete len:354 (+) Transcript_38202:433-1494(+)
MHLWSRARLGMGSRGRSVCSTGLFRDGEWLLLCSRKGLGGGGIVAALGHGGCLLVHCLWLLLLHWLFLHDGLLLHGALLIDRLLRLRLLPGDDGDDNDLRLRGGRGGERRSSGRLSGGRRAGLDADADVTMVVAVLVDVDVHRGAARVDVHAVVLVALAPASALCLVREHGLAGSLIVSLLVGLDLGLLGQQLLLLCGHSLQLGLELGLELVRGLELALRLLLLLLLGGVGGLDLGTRLLEAASLVAQLQVARTDLVQKTLLTLQELVFVVHGLFRLVPNLLELGNLVVLRLQVGQHRLLLRDHILPFLGSVLSFLPQLCLLSGLFLCDGRLSAGDVLLLGRDLGELAMSERL